MNIKIIKSNRWNGARYQGRLRGILLFALWSVLSALSIEAGAQTGQIIITAGDNACVGQARSLDAEIQGIDEAWIDFTKFSWSITSGSGSLSSTSGRTVDVTWNTASGGTVRVIYLGGSLTTETGTQTVYPGTKAVTPFTPPNVSLSGPTLVGAGHTVTLNAAGANNYYGWQYKPASSAHYINMSGNAASMTSPVLTENTTFRVTGYNTTLCSDVQTIVVNVVKSPTLSAVEGIVFSDLTNATYTMNATPGANATGCNWYTSAGTLVKTNSTSANLPLGTLGANHFYVKSVNGGVESGPVNFTIYKLKATPVISFQGPDFSCGGDQVKVKANLQGIVAGMAVTYSWTGFKNGVTQELDLGQVYTNQTMYLQVNATAPLGIASTNSGSLTLPVQPGTRPNAPSMTVTNCGTTIQLSGAAAGETYYVAVEKREMNTWLPAIVHADTDGDGVIQLGNDDQLVYHANYETRYKAYVQRGNCKSAEVLKEANRFDATALLQLSQASPSCAQAQTSVQLSNGLPGAAGLTWKRKKVSDGSITSVTGNLNQLTHSFLLDEPYEVWAEVADDLGCLRVSNSISMTGVAVAAPKVALVQTDCQNGLFLLQAQGGGDGDTYQWYRGSLSDPNPVSTTTPRLLVEGLQTTTPYFVTITNDQGCEGTAASITLTGYAKLTPPTLASAPEAMLDPYKEDGTTLKDVVIQVNGAVTGQTYLWTNGTTVVEDASGTYTAQYAQTTYVTVAIKNTTTGCVGEPITIPVRIRHDYQGVDATQLNMVSTQVVRIPNVTTEEGLNSLSVIGRQTLRSNTYLDGLGRLVQNVSKEVTPDEQDAVKTVLYDDMGRRSIEYLGYNAGTHDGVFKTNPITAVEGFYKNEGTKDHATDRYPYAQVNYEPSPLNRSFKSFAPGKSWVGQAKGGETQVRTNNANEVRKWQVNNDLNAAEVTTGQEVLTLSALEGNRTQYQAQQKIILTEGFMIPAASPSVVLEINPGDQNKPIPADYYAAGELLVVTATDEDGKVTETYTNKYGQVILKRAKVDATTWAETYNIYNQFNQLSYVLSPEAVKTLKNNQWQWEYNGHDVREEVMRLSYRYYYDARGRAIIKEVPNAGKTVVVYDDLDRPILTQNARQRLEGKWDFVKYDSLSRPVVSGVYTDTETRANLQTTLDQGFISTYPRFEHFDTTETAHHYYTNATFPKENLEVLSVNYYDDYRWQQIQAGFELNSEFGTITGTTYFKQVLGAPTAGKVKRLDGSGKFMFSAIYYDERGRVKQTLSENHKEGIDVAVQEYQFDGQVKQTVMKHQRKISGTHYENHYIQQWMKYDHVGRVTEAYHKITDTYTYRTVGDALNETGFDPEPISKAEYNRLGQVIQSKVGANHLGQALQTIDYKFNIRGWLTHLNDAHLSTQSQDNDLFGFELKYESGGTNQYFNGNIAQMRWKSALDGVQRKYDYEYDGLDRLKKAIYSDDDAQTQANFTVDGGAGASGIQYDLNGNILRLRRFGLPQAGGVFDVIDDLSYHYQGNQLLGVDDATDETVVNGDAKDFRDDHKYATHGQEYHYDENGNLTSDKNKHITSIRYNRFDMPQTILFATGEMIEFFYDGSGSKLRKVVTAQDGTDKITDYVAGFVYEDEHLQFESTGVGRALYTPNNGVGQSLGTGNLWAYEYYYTDHQGNMRMSFRRGDAITTHARMEDATQDKTVNGFAYDGSVVASSPAGTGQAAKVGADTQPLGIWKTLVMSKGDQVEMKVQSYISGAPQHTQASGLEAFVTNLAGSYNPLGEGRANNPNGLLVGIRYTPGNEPGPGNNLPAAYLRYVFYNDQGEAVKSDRVYVADLANGAWQQLMLNFTAETNGTLQVYTANESNAQVVYFDNMEVTFTPQLIAQETHYYPFGMQMMGIGKQGMTPNRYLYNAQTEREESFGLQWDETPFRRYDPQLGRFHGVDALAAMMPGITPYQYGFNNPVMLNDPSGLAPSGDPGNSWAWFDQASEDHKKVVSQRENRRNGFSINNFKGSNNRQSGANASQGNFSASQSNNYGGGDPFTIIIKGVVYSVSKSGILTRVVLEGAKLALGTRLLYGSLRIVRFTSPILFLLTLQGDTKQDEPVGMKEYVDHPSEHTDEYLADVEQRMGTGRLDSYERNVVVPELLRRKHLWYDKIHSLVGGLDQELSELLAKNAKLHQELHDIENNDDYTYIQKQREILRINQAIDKNEDALNETRKIIDGYWEQLGKPLVNDIGRIEKYLNKIKDWHPKKGNIHKKKK